MMKATEIMRKQPPVCEPDALLRDVGRKMAEGNTMAVPVVDPKTHRPIGLVTHDSFVQAAADGAAPDRTPVSRYMGKVVPTIREEDDLQDISRTGLIRQGCENPIVVVNEREQVVGLIEQPGSAIEVAQVEAGQEPAPPGFRSEGMELLWTCTNCGYTQPRSEPLPDFCPNCGKPKEYFVRQTED